MVHLKKKKKKKKKSLIKLIKFIHFNFKKECIREIGNFVRRE